MTIVTLISCKLSSKIPHVPYNKIRSEMMVSTALRPLFIYLSHSNI